MKPLLFTLFLLLLVDPVQAQSVTLNDPNQTYFIFEHCTVLEVKPGTVTIDSLLRHPEHYQFVSVKKKPLKPEAEKDYEGKKDVWLRVELTNRTHANVLLQFLMLIENHVVVYEVANRHLLHQQMFSGMGATINPNETFQQKRLIFPLRIPNGQSHTLYVYVARFTWPTLHITAQSVWTLQQTLYSEDLMVGLFMGFILMILIYSLLLFVRLGEWVNVIYVVWILLVAWTMLETTNQVPNLSPALHNIHAIINNHKVFWIELVHTLFALSFLQIRQRSRGLYRVSWLVIAFYGVSIVLKLINQGFIMLPFLAMVLDGLYSIVAGMVIYRRGVKPALYFVIGNIVFYIGQYVYIMTSYGLYPITFWTYNSYYFSAFGEILLFTLGLSYKVNLLKKHQDEAIQEQLRLTQENQILIETQNRVLEEKVEQRTAELRASQAQLIQKEKLASLGELTAGIAHEIQNPLNFVNNFSEVSNELVEELEQEVDAGHAEEVKAITSDLRQNLQKVSHHGRRASAIVQGMLEHSRTSTGEPTPTNLNQLAGEYLRLAYQGQQAKNNAFTVSIQTNFDTNLISVNVVAQDIGRVLLNLYNNAFYAVGQRAKQDKDGYQPTVWVSTRQEPGKVMICVKDNGTGISKAIEDKIFQPFFTTKPTGEGTGLGLSLSYDIVTKGHSGTMTVESVEGEGPQFVITLPC
ncbi:7TM diverse intracellular signaling domain-containing protein [Spirosoma aerolatum]|uniref:7TM diverse intracellular signaling domain-containing protein n=1 Tax=Spirosoma aerolatum TaxID=1211326 RepID=UPI0009AD7B2B|nr:7TM diverse intracellular signaling domain-containing protein [Spirosoma aerolatum]